MLLHLLARLAERHPLPVIRAIHVHHGLQAVADEWPAHCQVICDGLGIELKTVRVHVEPGSSLEQAARDARYQAFSEHLGKGELLLTGQHLDDQAETVLFRLLRGAGVRGLAGMPNERVLGRGRLVRPLLGTSRKALEAYAEFNDLVWIEDPSNQQRAHARNYLRRDVLPLLRQRWPQAALTLSRTAAHMSEAQQLLDELAQEDLSAAKVGDSLCWLSLPSLALPALRALSTVRQRNALRYWLSHLTLAPDEAHWAGWESLRDAAPDAAPRWRLIGGELRRSCNRIWWLTDAWLASPGAPVDWPDPAAHLTLPYNGTLRIEGAPPAGKLQIRYRKGGEVLQVPNRGRRDLKRLLNEAGVPTFVRGRLPLLYCDDELVAAANLPLHRDGRFALYWCIPAF